MRSLWLVVLALAMSASACGGGTGPESVPGGSVTPTETPPETPTPIETPTRSPEEMTVVESGIYLIRPGDGTATPLTSGESDVAPAWSPDGQLIAFARLDATGTSGAICLIDRDGSNETRLAEGGRPFAWSPDGHHIAFRGTSGDLYVVEADGTGLVNLTEGRMRVSPGLGDGLSWSPDGQRIAFAADGFAIYVIDDDGGNPIRLQADEPRPRDMGGVPSWSADGMFLAATVWYTNQPDILVFNTDGTGARPIAMTSANEGDAAWSPDGSRLSYWSFTGAPPGQAVHVVDADGTHETIVFESSSSNGFVGDLPSWSADGKHLAFLGEGDTLYTVDADGGNLRALVRVVSSDSPAVWSPEGDAIAVSVVPAGE